MKLRIQLATLGAIFGAVSIAGAQESNPAHEEQAYKEIGDVELQMRVYKPAGWKASDKRPAMVLFFGGGWRNGTPDQFDPHCRHLAEKGIYAKIATISPYHHLTKALPPTIIFHGTNDDAVPFETVEAFAKKGKDFRVKKLTLESYEGRPHGFFNFGRAGGKDYQDTVRKMDGFLADLGWIEST